MRKHHIQQLYILEVLLVRLFLDRTLYPIRIGLLLCQLDRLSWNLSTLWKRAHSYIHWLFLLWWFFNTRRNFMTRRSWWRSCSLASLASQWWELSWLLASKIDSSSIASLSIETLQNHGSRSISSTESFRYHSSSKMTCQLIHLQRKVMLFEFLGMTLESSLLQEKPVYYRILEQTSYQDSLGIILHHRNHSTWRLQWSRRHRNSHINLASQCTNINHIHLPMYLLPHLPCLRSRYNSIEPYHKYHFDHNLDQKESKIQCTKVRAHYWC